MALKARFSDEDIKFQLRLVAHQIETDLIEIMAYVAEKFVKEARDGLNISGAFPKGDYTDRTANLRSSIGYFILKDGVIIRENYTGTLAGIAAALNAMHEVPRIGDLQLIVVAGMSYASYVESKGYNVITSQADIAAVNLDKLVKKYASKLKLRI